MGSACSKDTHAGPAPAGAHPAGRSNKVAPTHTHSRCSGLPMREWTAEDVSAWLTSFGPSYAPLSAPFLSLDVDGEFLLLLLAHPPVDQERQLRDELGVATAVQRHGLLKKIRALVLAQDTRATGAWTAKGDDPTHTGIAPALEGAGACGATCTPVRSAAQLQEEQQLQGAQAASAAGRQSSQAEPIPPHESAMAAWATLLPPPIHNLPQLAKRCMHMHRGMQRITDAFAQTAAAGVSAPIVALTGAAGSGKSELAKRWAMGNPQRAEGGACAHSAPPAAYIIGVLPADGKERRLCWFFNAESEESLLRSYKLLCAALKLDWRTEDKESEADTFARMTREAQQQLMRYDSLLLFDNVVSLELLEPYLPSLSGLRVRVLLTSLHESVVLPDVKLGRHVLSLNQGLAEEEAVALIERTSGMRLTGDEQAKEGQQAREDALALLRELDYLPLAVATAGLYIFAQRQPKRSLQARAAASPPSYGPREFLLEVRSHSSAMLKLGATLKGQSDYKLGQATALQLAIGKTPPRVRALLDYCTLLDSQALPYELMADLYASTRHLDTEQGEEEPSEAESAADAFDSMLESPHLFSLLCVDWDTRRIYMHRSTQLQLLVLAQARCAGTKSVGPSPVPTFQRQQSMWKRLAGATNAPTTATAVASSTAATSTTAPASRASAAPAAKAAGDIAAVTAAYDAALRAAPSPVHQWKAGMVAVLLTAIQRCWPAREEDTVSLLALEPIIPTLTRLLEECSALPMLHAELAPLHAQLMSHLSLLLLHLEVREEWVQLQQLATQTRILCESGSESHQLMRMWSAVSLFKLNEEAECRVQLQSLLAELTSAHPNARVELRVRVALRLADALREANVPAAMALCESATGWLQEHLGSADSLLWARVHFLRGCMHPDEQAGQECLRLSLEMAQRVCGEGSSQEADARRWLTLRAQWNADVFPHHSAVQHIYDRVYGCCSRKALQSVQAHATRLLKRGQGAELPALLQARCSQLLRAPDDRSPDGSGIPGIGEHERTVTFLEAAAKLLLTSHREEGAKLERQARDMSRRVYGPAHVLPLELMARVAHRKYEYVKTNKGPDLADAILHCRYVADRFLQLLPGVQGRVPLVLEKLRQASRLFSDMGELPTSLLILEHALQYAHRELGADHMETAALHAELAKRMWGFNKHAGAAGSMRHAMRIQIMRGDVRAAMHSAVWLADLMLQVKDVRGEEDARRQVLQLAQQAMEPLAELARAQHEALALLYQRRRMYTQAMVSSMCDLRIQQMISGPGSDVDQTNDPLAFICEQSRLTEAPVSQADLQRVLADVAAALPSDPLALAMSHSNLANALLAARQTEEADAMQREAIRLLQAGGHPITHALSVSAAVQRQRGDFAQELATCLRRLDLLRLEGDEKRISDAIDAVASAHLRLRQYSAAASFLDAAADDMCKRLGEDAPHAKSKRSLAVWCRMQVEGSQPHQSHQIRFDAPGGTQLGWEESWSRLPANVVLGAEGPVSPYQLRPLPGSPRVLYFEVELTGEGNCVSIGFACAGYSVCDALGSVPHSVGWSGEDGELQCAASSLRNADYGPRWSTGDVLGAGMDLDAGCVFFTHNGVRLQDVPVDVAAMPHAAISFGSEATYDELVRLNLGDSPFSYDHAQHMQPALASARSLCPYPRIDPRCHWSVKFDDPMRLHRLQKGWGEACVVLAEPPHRLRPLSAAHPRTLYYELTVPAAGSACALVAGLACPEYDVHLAPGSWDHSVGVSAAEFCVIRPGVSARPPVSRRPLLAGDVLGFGVDVSASLVFFVLNGVRVLDLRMDVAPLTHACIAFGAEAGSEQVAINMGDQPFRYEGTEQAEYAIQSSLVRIDANLLLRRSRPLAGFASSAVLTSAAYRLRPLGLSGSPAGADRRPLYFELRVLDTGSNMREGEGGGAPLDLPPCHAAIGFVHGEYNANSMPGWEERAIGMHGADGRVYHAGGTVAGPAYGPMWRVGDVIGAGMDLDAGVAFFTHQGVRLADIKADVSGMPYACVGFGGAASTERVKLNMGATPFAYQPGRGEMPPIPEP